MGLARDILIEFDEMVIKYIINGMTKEEAEELVKVYQKEKYGHQNKESSIGND